MVGVPSGTVFYLPDLLPISASFTLGLNPHYAQMAAESRAWLTAHKVLSERTLAMFTKANMEQLVARCYPSAPFYEFRTVCDFVCLLVVIDEMSDEQTGARALRTGESFLNVLRDPSSDDGRPLAQITREYARASTGGCADGQGAGSAHASAGGSTPGPRSASSATARATWQA